MIHIGIDPSVTCSGRAVFRDRTYIGCEIARASTLTEACGSAATHWLPKGERFGDRIALAWIELPMIYPVSKQKGDPNDLISIAAVAGAYAAQLPGVHTFVRPHEWKGQAPKNVIEMRIRQALSADERDALERDLAPMPKSLRNNAIDAVGIVMKGIGRL